MTSTTNLPKDPTEIAQLLSSSDEEQKNLGYEAFLGRTHWHPSATPEDLKLMACRQLGVAPGKVIASNVKRIEPRLLWASQSGLEADKLNMVEIAYQHVKKKGKSLPPIVVWNFFDNQKIRKVIHDGHHRAYFSYRLNIKLRAIILEPLGNYEQVLHKFRYAFQISKRVTDLPVMPSQSLLAKKAEKDRAKKEQKAKEREKNEIDSIGKVSVEKNEREKPKKNRVKRRKGEKKAKETAEQPKKLAIPADIKDERYAFNWDYIHQDQFGEEELKHFDVTDIKKMFERRKTPMVPELAYLSFLLHGRWGQNFDIERGIKRTQMQLRLPLYEGEGLSHTQRKINPGKIWASQDSLDLDVVEMVESAMKYMVDSRKPIPPVIVWLIKDSSRYNYVCHDGHHRIYIAYLMKIPIPAVILEYWIDNRQDPLLRKKIPYERVDSYVKDLPIEEFEGVRYTLRDKFRNKRKEITKL